MKFAKYLRTLFLTEHPRWLLLLAIFAQNFHLRCLAEFLFTLTLQGPDFGIT